MNINNLIYGEAHGLIKLDSSSIDGKNDFYNLVFDHIKVDNVKVERVDKINLKQFNLKPFANVFDQKVEFSYNEVQYSFTFDEIVLNNLEIEENITTISNEKYCKFKGNFYSNIQFIEIEKQQAKKEEVVLSKKNIVSESKTESEKVEKTILKSDGNGGCFGRSNKSETKNLDTQEKKAGCFSNSENYNDVKKFYKVNSDYLKTEKEKSIDLRKQYWANQKKVRQEVYNRNYSPFRNISSSFLNTLSLLVCFVGLIILTLLFLNSSNSNDTTLASIGLIALSILLLLGWFLPAVSTTFRGRILRWIATIFSLFILFVTISSLLTNVDDYDYDRDREDDTEIIDDTLIPNDDDEKVILDPDESDAEGNDNSDQNKEDKNPTTEKVIKRSLSWNDFQNLNYNEDFKTSVKDYNDGKQYLSRLNIAYTGKDFWTRLYANVVRHESKKNKYIKKMYSELLPENNKSLSRREKLDAIITSVQEIPYYLVHEGSCSQSARQSSFSREYHLKGEPCLASKKYGLALPSEFSANFKGDCDTRSLFLYMFLKQIGYDVAILVSEAYGHAILGVNIPGSGKYVKYRGKRYLTLETTSKGWKIGQLPPNCNDTRKWRVALN